MDQQDQQSSQEAQPEFFSQATYIQEPEIKKTDSSHPSFSSIFSQALPTLIRGIQSFFYQTTLTEKVVMISSILTIVFTLTKWGAIQNEAITGISSIVFFIGWALIISALLSMGTLLWCFFGKQLPKILPPLPTLQMLLGIGIIQLGIIGFTVLTAFKQTVSLFNAEDPSYSPLYIVLFGILIFTAGLFEERTQQRKNSPTKLPADMYARPETNHDLDRILNSEES